MDCQGPNVSYFRRKTLMAHYGLPRTQRFLFQAENFNGALWIAKDPTFFLFHAENFDGELCIARAPFVLMQAENFGLNIFYLINHFLFGHFLIQFNFTIF